MSISITSETDTVIKKIIPYLQRRGYLIESDVEFEAPAKREERQNLGYVDLLVTAGRKTPAFLIEAKRASKKLTLKDRDQAISYGKSYKVPFVVVTNGSDIMCYNTETRAIIKWDGKDTQKIPTKEQLKAVLLRMKKDQSAHEVDLDLAVDRSLPFRPGLSPKQLKALFYRCHSDIRRIERSEDRAFQDFSKILFLKLYEEKCDIEGSIPPYSWTFHELAEKKDHQADQVRNAVNEMIKTLVSKQGYGEVLSEPISLKNDKTYQIIVRRLSLVSFYDSSFDSKGAAFEYYVRATLKGKKLGQYFTPRPVIHLMSVLIGKEKIANAAMMGTPLRVLDPACGTGGFLVYLMKQNIEYFQNLLRTGKIAQSQFDKCIENIKAHTFFGADANDSVASAAKMNMIIAGDGQSNIKPEDTLSVHSQSWSIITPNCDIIITNPPFGTSEADSLSAADYAQFPVATKKGQLLFLQKMVLSAQKKGGEVCTVIDEGVLNTDSASGIRKWILENCVLKAVVRLPEVTFKPNKINVRSSILYLQRREHPDVDLEAVYDVTFIDIKSLGYQGSGDPIRSFDEAGMMDQIERYVHDLSLPKDVVHSQWSAFKVPIANIYSDSTYRFDLKYWDQSTCLALDNLKKAKHPTLQLLSLDEIRRGKSPLAETYVDESDGYALVIKAGTNISKFGEVVFSGDFIEKNQFEELEDQDILDGDILLSSTGSGTLGKCAVYRGVRPAIADGHVTVIRVDQEKVYPEYVCDYLRLGFGATQVQRLYTGSTGLIELTPDQVKSIYIELPPTLDDQKTISQEWRAIETKFRTAMHNAATEFEESRAKFLTIAPQGPAIVGTEPEEEEEEAEPAN